MKRLVLLAAALGSICHAQQACPWLNVATASGVLESTATLKADNGRCDFKSKTGDLRIEVTTTTAAEEQFSVLEQKWCKTSGAPLKAIGNEAVTCSHRNGEVAIGRVRDHLFTITLAIKSVEQQTLFEKARLVAEQVSGILF